jgi:hypothetical protein
MGLMAAKASIAVTPHRSHISLDVDDVVVLANGDFARGERRLVSSMASVSSTIAVPSESLT